MKIAILGFGLQGRSAYEYWNNSGNQVTVCDMSESLDLPDGVEARLGPDHLKNLDGFDLIVRSPVVHPKDIVAANSAEILEKVTTVTNEFMKVCPTRNIIGTTGTKGKGTTSTLITKMLETAGKRVHLGGNIGTPPLDLLHEDIQSDDWVVLELANFQLIDLKYSPPLAVCLMVVPEHMDWHKDIDEYITAKQQLFVHQAAEDTAVYYAANDYSQHIAGVSPGQKVPYMKSPGADVLEGNVVIDNQIICGVDEIKLLGKHNWQNVCAAVTAFWQVEQNTEAARQILTTFTGLEHRLEFVREFDEVKYYDDSFGTTPETAMVAIEAFEQPKVVILGGSDKGASYEGLAKTIKENNVRSVVLIGDTAPAIRKALEEAGFTNIVDGGSTMPKILETARNQAKSGDIVLLSTGCASFGLFKNYKDRGEQFRANVQAVA